MTIQNILSSLFPKKIGVHVRGFNTTPRDRHRPIAYYLKRLDTVVRGMPQCLRLVAAATEVVLTCLDIVAFHPLTLFIPHAMQALLIQSRMTHLMIMFSSQQS